VQKYRKLNDTLIQGI
jgi:hypothetical protein